MRGSVAKIINKACSKENQAFKNELKRTWNRVPSPLRNKFKRDMIESYSKEELLEQSA